MVVVVAGVQCYFRVEPDLCYVNLNCVRVKFFFFDKPLIGGNMASFRFLHSTVISLYVPYVNSCKSNWLKRECSKFITNET